MRRLDLLAVVMRDVLDALADIRRDGLYRRTLDDGRALVIKRRAHAPEGFFSSEARGLAYLRRDSGLRVPEVFAVTATAVVMEDLGRGRPGPDFHALAARGLAHQHRQHGPAFGFDHQGWCGDSEQDNTWHDDGHRFFADCRLLPQARRAYDAGRLDATSMRRIERLCGHLHERIPEAPPVLLHGDLWRGNLHCAGDGRPALIDAAAVHYGWAEAELAMLTLFGAPPDAFFLTYAEHAPLADDWHDRALLYNLYHLLNHLNLFGSGYAADVRNAIETYA